MQKMVFALAAFATAALGCSGSSSNGTGSTVNPFVGTWSCTTTETDTVALLGAQPPRTIADMVVITDLGSGTINAAIADDAGTSCQLKFSTNGGTATVENGQSCTGGTLTATFTSGTYTASGNTLTGNLQGNFTGTVSGTPVSGTLTQSTTCSKS